MKRGITVDRSFHVRQGWHSRKELRDGQGDPPHTPGRVPRVARLMALAIR